MRTIHRPSFLYAHAHTTQAAESDEGGDDYMEDDYMEDDYMEGDDLSPSGRRTPTWYAHTEPGTPILSPFVSSP